MTAQRRNHTSQTGRCGVMGNLRGSKKSSKFQITPLKIFLGSSEWYQSIRLNILHLICDFQKILLGYSGQIQKNTLMVTICMCALLTFQFHEISKGKFHFTDFTEKIRPTQEVQH